MGNWDVASIPTFSCCCRSCPSECGSATNVICKSVHIFKSSIFHIYFVTGLWASAYIKTELKLKIATCAINHGCQVTGRLNFVSCLLLSLNPSWVWHMLDITILHIEFWDTSYTFGKSVNPWLLPVTRSYFQTCVYFVLSCNYVFGCCI